MINERIKMYKQAAEAPNSPPTRSKAPKMKAKHVKQINSTMSQQKKLAKASSKSIVNAIKQGNLTKKGAVRKNWKSRFWILSYSTLSYYISNTVCNSLILFFEFIKKNEIFFAKYTN